MSIETSQKLKAQLTDKYVVVKSGVAELQRFASLTGIVKTVNMSGRALVQFDGPADISWYDIDPQCLSVVDAPAKKAAAPEKHTAAAKATPEKKPAAPAAAAGKPAGKSPLEMARAQGAVGAAAGTKPTAPAAGAAAPAAKKLSPLEQARQQGSMQAGGAPAAKPESAAPPVAEAPASPPEAKPVAKAPTAPAGKKLSPLELARQQGAFKPNED